MAIIKLIHVNDIPHYLPQVTRMLRDYVKPSTGYDLPGVQEELLAGTMQAWVVNDFEAIAITAIQDRPVQKVLWAQFLIGQRMRDWLGDLGEILADYARHHSCKAVEFAGRKGWSKINTQFPEYHPQWIVFRREL